MAKTTTMKTVELGTCIQMYQKLHLIYKYINFGPENTDRISVKHTCKKQSKILRSCLWTLSRFVQN